MDGLTKFTTLAKTMTYLQEISANKNDPQQLEALYQLARSKYEADQFGAGLSACLASEPENLLLQAWHYRLLNQEKEQGKPKGAEANWKLAIPLAAANGLIFWVLSSPQLNLPREIPALVVLAAPITALFVIWFLHLASRTNYRRALAVSAGLIALVSAALLLHRLATLRASHDYLILLVPQLALLAWAGIGIGLVGLARDAEEGFAFLIKSLEVFIIGGLYLIAGMMLGAITLGMFSALSINLPDALLRLMAAGGAGLIPVIAVATIYNPLRAPKGQDFKQGLSGLIGTMMRLLLPLTLFVLLVYIFIIPLNFSQPFTNRDVLIVYNAMLFAIMGLIVGATPIEMGELSPRLSSALKNGILAVAVLAGLVSLYALSAVLYRTVINEVTINRLTMIGWNIINTSLLAVMTFRLLQKSPQPWNTRIKEIYRLGAALYVVWALLVILVMPVIFR